MAVIDYSDYLDAGIASIFPLHPIIAGGRCGCGNDECSVPGKHPVAANWQHVSGWTQEQIAYLTGEDEASPDNKFLSGFGVNLRPAGLLVVDVDPRNGGWQGLETLCARLGSDIRQTAGFVVKTGGGGLHIYYRLQDDSASLVTSIRDIPGIDFKSVGYVVGCGSSHASGDLYHVAHGSPHDIGPAPAPLTDMLRRPDRIRSQSGADTHDITLDELAGIVSAIKNDGRDYERWLRVGMGLHHATQGAQNGYELWLRWSEQCDAHDDALMPMKWGSFGKSANVVTLGTLIEWARQSGWATPVTFEAGDDFTGEALPGAAIDTMAGVDLEAPPGFVGRVARWINERAIFPRRNLAVAAALVAVGNAAGLRYRAGTTGVTLNVMMFGVAASGSGKDQVLQRLQECHAATGIIKAQHGAIKSEQEITRNILRHQAAYYVLDEVGVLLAKLSNASKKGTTAYLEGVVAAVMSVYSKAGGVLAVGGDLKEEMREKVMAAIAKINTRVEKGTITEAEAEPGLRGLAEQLKAVDHGIQNPFLSLYGTAEPYGFHAALNREMFVNGFLGRAMIVEEHDNVPRRKPSDHISNDDLPMTLRMGFQTLYTGGQSAPDDHARVERQGDVVTLLFSADAEKLSCSIADYWQQISEDEDAGEFSLSAIPRRAWEQTIKLAGILGASEGIITEQHVRWAHAFVKRDVEYKLRVCKAKEASDSHESSVVRDGILDAIRSKLHKDHSITIGRLHNAHRGYSRDTLLAGLEHLVATNEAVADDRTTSKGRTFRHYFAAG